MGIAPLDVHERTGEQDQAVIEVAPIVTPRSLQYLVTLPERFLIEELDERCERGWERDIEMAHGRRHRQEARSRELRAGRVRGAGGGTRSEQSSRTDLE